MDNKIKQNIIECQKIVEDIRRSINDGKCVNCMIPTCKHLSSLYNALKQLAENIKLDLPIEAQQIQVYLPGLVGVPRVNTFDFGAIIAIINIIKARYNLTNNNSNQKKIFISHSSKDKHIVQLFVDDILQLGIGLKPEHIFCTSIEDMGIKNGEDIRKHIHENIKNADYSILLISKNYKKSEICLNEMGAVWAYDNKVRFYILPDADFDSIGWLCNPKIAERIDSSIALDELHEQLQQYYSLQNESIRSWSRQREKFLQDIKRI